MGECRSENSCESHENHGSCGHGESRREEECTFAEDLLHLAKKAKQELLKEKMKRALEAKIGTKLDKAAQAAVDALLEHFQNAMAQKHACEHYKENLTAAFKS